MKGLKLKIIFVALLISAQACEYSFPEAIPSDPLDPGSADFSKIAILGGDLGAGYMDGALYSESQQKSIGALLAEQINLNAGDHIDFNQPDINSINGFNLIASNSEVRGKSFLKFIAPGESQLFKDTNPGELPQAYTGPQLNNFSVPFMRTPQVLDPDLSDNPFYNRFAPNPGISTLIDQVISNQPTMTVLQLGWQDLLPYGMAGLTGSINPDPDNIEIIDLTPIDLFRSSYQEIVDLLLQNTESEFILTNIPDISDFPFFNSISTQAFINSDEATFLTNYYRDYNIQVSKSNSNQTILRPTIKFFFDDPPHLWKAVIDDPSLVDRTQEDGTPLPKWRQIEEGEYILWSIPGLPSLQEPGLGTTLPLPKTLFFTENDKEQIETLVNQYNMVIAAIAASNQRLHLFDWYTVSASWAQKGVMFNGVLHTYDFQRSGIFSSDGTNLNIRGGALFTNELIKFINDQFGSNIPLTDPNSLPGNVFVNDF